MSHPPDRVARPANQPGGPLPTNPDQEFNATLASTGDVERYQPEVEIIPAGEYTRVDFNDDRAAIEQAAVQRAVVVERVQAWEESNTIELSRLLRRMHASEFWRGPGMKGNDREFCEWLVAEVPEVNSITWARELLVSGRALGVLEKNAQAFFPQPVGASQIKALGSSWYLQRPSALVNVWMAAVEESGGQPSKELVAAKARRYKADVQSVELANAPPYEARRMHRQLAKYRRGLVALYREDAGPVDAFLRELVVSIRQEARS